MRIEAGDGLSAYLAAADETAAEILASNNAMMATLRTYDRYFRESLWNNQEPDTVPLVLWLNAYQLFLASVRIALSGHPAAVFPVLRTALESAAYGSLMKKRPELQDVWIKRHGSAAENKACKNAFKFSTAIASIEDRSPDICKLAILAYDGAIDYGAHPNIKGVLGHVSLTDVQDGRQIAVLHASLYGAHHIETIRGLCACMDFGFAIIGVIALSSENFTGSIITDLQSLNDAKNEASEPYSHDRERSDPA